MHMARDAGRRVSSPAGTDLETSTAVNEPLGYRCTDLFEHSDPQQLNKAHCDILGMRTPLLRY